MFERCPKCDGDVTMTVDIRLSAPSTLYSMLSKTNLRDKGVSITAALWETANFICPKCGLLEEGFGTYVSNLRNENETLIKENEYLKKELACLSNINNLIKKL